jgi:hypothetical protein
MSSDRRFLCGERKARAPSSTADGHAARLSLADSCAHSADGWTPLHISQPFYNRLTCDKRLVVLEGAGHFPIEPLALAQLDVAVREFLANLLTVRNNHPEREQRETIRLS